MSLIPTILYRESLMDLEEKEAIDYSGFQSNTLLTSLTKDNFVIPRYSVLPFAKLFYEELDNIGATCISSYQEHKFLADIISWSSLIPEYTPKSWDITFGLNHLPDNKAFIIKGETNSRKDKWNSHMFAKNITQAVNVYCRLTDDGLIGNQKIIAREYIPLKTFMIGINDLPITKEYRLFVHNGELLCWAFYWQNYFDDLSEKDKWEVTHGSSDIPWEWVYQVIEKLKHRANFFVMDIAETREGHWIVIELNDACMSGLSCINPHLLYNGLRKSIQCLID